MAKQLCIVIVIKGFFGPKLPAVISCVSERRFSPDWWLKANMIQILQTNADNCAGTIEHAHLRDRQWRRKWRRFGWHSLYTTLSDRGLKIWGAFLLNKLTSLICVNYHWKTQHPCQTWRVLCHIFLNDVRNTLEDAITKFLEQWKEGGSTHPRHRFYQSSWLSKSLGLN